MGHGRMNYETFAAFYNELMDEEYYDKWLEYTKQHIGNESKRILDLACGTGQLAVGLSKEGHHLVGLDLSEEMLSLAYNHALEHGQTIQFIQGDMRELEDVGSYQAVTCFSDSLCYMENEEEMYQVFSQVHSILEKDGLFLFDVHSLYKVNEIFPGYQYNYVSDEGAFTWTSFEGNSDNSVEHELTFFLPESESDTYRRYDELHKERTYSIDTYRLLLEKAGFKDIEVKSQFGKEDVQEQTERWFFSCRV